MLLVYISKHLGLNSIGYREYLDFVIDESLRMGCYFLWDMLSYDKSEFFITSSSINGAKDCFDLFMFLYKQLNSSFFKNNVKNDSLAGRSLKDLKINCLSNALISFKFIQIYCNNKTIISIYTKERDECLKDLNQLENS